MSMKKKEHKKNEPSLPEPSRRSFLNKLWLGLGIIAVLEFAGLVMAYLRPKKRRATSGEIGTVVEAGHVESFPLNSVTAFVRGKFYLCRMEDGGFLAVSRKCTHLGCTIPWLEKEKQFEQLQNEQSIYTKEIDSLNVVLNSLVSKVDQEKNQANADNKKTAKLMAEALSVSKEIEMRESRFNQNDKKLNQLKKDLGEYYSNKITDLQKKLDKMKIAVAPCRITVPPPKHLRKKDEQEKRNKNKE